MDVKDPTKMSFHLLPMKTETNFDVVHHIDLIGSSKKKIEVGFLIRGNCFSI